MSNLFSNDAMITMILQAPSASLCVSILDLHSDAKACGMLILDLCNSLSQKLVPVAPGVKNEELDHNLLIRSVATWCLKGCVKRWKKHVLGHGMVRSLLEKSKSKASSFSVTYFVFYTCGSFSGKIQVWETDRNTSMTVNASKRSFSKHYHNSLYSLAYIF